MTERAFVEDLAERAAGGKVRLEGREAHHLGTVRRAKVGARVLLLDGAGWARWAAIEAVERRAVELRILAEPPPAPPETTSASLAVCLPKGKRVRWLVEKATELGAFAIFPLRTARAVRDAAQGLEHKRDAWRQVAIEAAKQCGALRLPVFHPTLSLDEVWGVGAGLVLVLDPAGAESLGGVLRAHAAAARDAGVLMVIGPEGGLSPEELERLLAGGAISARLGATILRVETAAIASLAAVRAVLG